jgi:hypothetical protein
MTLRTLKSTRKDKLDKMRTKTCRNRKYLECGADHNGTCPARLDFAYEASMPVIGF